MQPLTQPQFLSILQKFLPEGAAWPRALDSVLTRLLSAFAYLFALLDLRLRDLLAELNPATADQMLADWEAFVGACDACCTSVPGTVEERRARVVARLNEQGSLSRAYFMGMAADLGYTDTTITELEPTDCETACDVPLRSSDLWRFVWTVNLPHQGDVHSYFRADSDCEALVDTYTFGPYYSYFQDDSSCDSPIDSYVMGSLECLFMKLKPAHTYVIFTYSPLEGLT